MKRRTLKQQLDDEFDKKFKGATYKPPQKEADLNKKVVEYLNTIPGCFARKRLAMAGMQGQVDVTGCLNGIRIELEGKVGNNTPSKKQEEELDRWKKVGAITGVYWSVEDVKKILERHGNWHPPSLKRNGFPKIKGG